MADSETTPPAWKRIPCHICGIEFRVDCPDRFERLEDVPCGCDGGCFYCDWTGINLRPVGGHKYASPLPKANAVTRFYANLCGGEVV